MHHQRAEPHPNPAARATSSSNGAGLRANNTHTPHETTRAQSRSLSKNDENMGTRKKKIANQYNSVPRSEKVKSLIARDQSCCGEVLMLLAGVNKRSAMRRRRLPTVAETPPAHLLRRQSGFAQGQIVVFITPTFRST